MVLRTLALGAVLLPWTARALPPRPPGLEDQVRQADRVVLAKVQDQRTILADGNPRHMVTVTTLDVQEDLKGTGPRKLELVQLGGKSGLWESHVAGDATFAPPETAVVFLLCRDPSARDRCALVGRKAGRMPVAAAASGAAPEVEVALPGSPARRPLAALAEDVRRAAKLPPLKPPAAAPPHAPAAPPSGKVKP